MGTANGKVVFSMGFSRECPADHCRNLEVERGGSDVIGINLLSNANDGKDAKLVIWSSKDGWQVDVYRRHHEEAGFDRFELHLSDGGSLKVINPG